MFRLVTTMARSTRAAAATATATARREMPRRAARTRAGQDAPAKVKKEVKKEEEDEEEEKKAAPKATRRKRAAAPAAATTESSPSPKRIKHEDDDEQNKDKAKDKDDDLRNRKLKAYAQHAHSSPFPDFTHPTPGECKLAHRILATQHGARHRPKTVIAPTSRAGCGDSPSVLDALVRTILSQNTSDTNSTRAKQSMDRVYGGSDQWDAIVAGGPAKLQAAIQCGGLSAVKTRVILGLLAQVHARYGVYSLDHLHGADSDDAMRELLGFAGVGPKTASCVLLFCLRRESFAVDTHVHRITGLLGWRPPRASRDETHLHLDARIPDEDKYGLHILLVAHGKQCAECRAGGKNLGQCALRNAFRKGKLKGEAGEDIKEEEEEEEAGIRIKDED